MNSTILFVLAALGVGLLLGAGCGRQDQEAPFPTYRLVDPSLRASSPTATPIVTRSQPSVNAPPAEATPIPAATIQDDTRYVLAAPAKALIFSGDARIGNDGRLTVNAGIPPPLREASHLLFVAKVKQAGAWHDLEPVLLPVGTASQQKRTLAVAFSGPSGLTPGTVKANVVAYEVDMHARRRWKSRPIPIARRAFLQFAFGILEPAQPQGAVRFSIEACENDRCDTIFDEVLTPVRGKILGWQERRLPLDGLRGRTPAFVFTTEVVAQRKGTFSLPVWANPTIYRPAPAPPQQPNVILLSIDTLRADHLTSYGYRYNTAPFIDEQFGKGGVVFDSCVAAATTTTPSHMTMFTSLQPEAHYLKTGLEVLSPGITTVAQILRAAGVETAAVTEDGWLGIRHGFGRGFNVYVENKSANIMAPTGQVDVTLKKAAQWLTLNADKRFFLFLHTFQVHSPYAPPQRYAGLFQPGTDSAASVPPPHVLEMADYDREIRYTDDELRKFFGTMRALGLNKNTVFIIVSDHGEEFLEHGHMEHGAQNYEETTHVPLLVRGPGIAEGRRVKVNVGHIDILPTVLDLFGIQVPVYANGKSLLPLLRGDSAPGLIRALEERPLFTESLSPFAMGPGHALLPFDRPAYSVRVGNTKLHRYKTPGGFRYELYNLARDPGEQHNLWPQRDSNAEALAELLNQYEAVSAAARSLAMHAQVAGRPEEEPEKQTTHLDPEQEEKLRALGYLH